MDKIDLDDQLITKEQAIEAYIKSGMLYFDAESIIYPIVPKFHNPLYKKHVIKMIDYYIEVVKSLDSTCGLHPEDAITILNDLKEDVNLYETEY